MVGYDPNQINLSVTEQMYVSVGTSILTRLLIQPFDVVKIRFQLQYEPISKKSPTSKYKNIPQTVSTIVKEEGALALWKGHLTGQMLSISYNSAQFFWYDFFTKTTYDIWPSRLQNVNKYKHLYDFGCGGLAATMTILTNQPLDTIRTRLVSQGEPKLYKNIPDAIKKIYLKEGFMAFYKGTIPAIFLVAPESAFRFGVYSLLNSNWNHLISFLESVNLIEKKSSLKSNEIGMIQSSINGSISGVCAKTIVYPFDLAKKRLQIQGFEDARKNFGKVVKFTGLFNCFVVTLKEEGFLGIYKGYYPSMIKAAVYSGLILSFYEYFSNLTRAIKLK